METKRNRDSKKHKINNFARYSGIGFEMLGIIFLGTFGGVKLDEKLQWAFPVFTIVLSLLSVFIALYLALRDLLRKK